MNSVTFTLLLNRTIFLFIVSGVDSTGGSNNNVDVYDDDFVDVDVDGVFVVVVGRDINAISISSEKAQGMITSRG